MFGNKENLQVQPVPQACELCRSLSFLSESSWILCPVSCVQLFSHSRAPEEREEEQCPNQIIELTCITSGALQSTVSLLC